jgi:hypothetical protein
VASSSGWWILKLLFLNRVRDREVEVKFLKDPPSVAASLARRLWDWCAECVDLGPSEDEVRLSFNPSHNNRSSRYFPKSQQRLHLSLTRQVLVVTIIP